MTKLSCLKDSLLILFAALLLASPAVGEEDDLFGVPKSSKRQSFEDAVPSIEAQLEPAEVKRGQKAVWKFTVKLAPGWHTYPTRQTEKEYQSSVTTFKFADSDEVKWRGKLNEPPYKVRNEDGKKVLAYEGEVVWRRSLIIPADVKPGKKTVEVPVQLVVCDEKRCLPPEILRVKAEYTALEAVAPAPPDDPAAPSDEDSAAVTDASAGTLARGMDPGFLSFLATGVFWGLVSLLTPCVFPMIPITVSFFLKQSEKEHHRPVTMAVVYTATIVTVLTIGAVLLLEVFQDLIQHGSANLILGALFVVFALSLFGMFEIRLPSGIARFTSAREGQGGLIGTMFMALTFTIISFSCVAPFLGGFAGLTAESRPFWQTLLGALAFSGTFAAPFFFLALFPTLLKTLPKSGSWLNTVKVVMGFLELAAGLKFLRASEILFTGKADFLTYDFVLGMYIALSFACGLYLLNLFRLPHDTPTEHLGVTRLIFSLIFLSIGLYLAPGLVKQRPEGAVFAWLDSFLLPTAPKDLPWVGNLDTALKNAKEEDRLVFVDFTGDT